MTYRHILRILVTITLLFLLLVQGAASAGIPSLIGNGITGKVEAGATRPGQPLRLRPEACTPISNTLFAWTPLTPTAGLALTLTAGATGTLPLTFTWGFGDGSLPRSGQIVTHTYGLPDRYTVELTATNGCGRDAITHTLTVIPACEPAHGTLFTWIPLTPTAGQPVTLTGQAGGTLPLTLTWDLGDGTPPSVGETVSHTYALPGPYTVVLTAANACGHQPVAHTLTVIPACEPVHNTTFVWTPLTPTVGEPITLTAGASGTLPLAFTWEMDDETLTHTGQAVTHTYGLPGQHTVHLAAANTCGHQSVAHTLTVIPACEPVQGAVFAWTPLTPTVGEAVTLTGQATGTAPVSFTWAFGDGENGVGPAVVHSYPQPGSYAATLTATNACGHESVAHTLTVIPACVPVQDVALSWIPLTPTVGQVVTLTAQATGTAPLTFTWNLGDGTQGQGISLTHRYMQPGSFQLSLYAENGCGHQSIAHTLTVVPACVPVHEPSFTWTPLAPTVGEAVTLTGQASGTLPLSFTWSLGDGTPPLTGERVLYTYTLPAFYTVTLTVANACGQQVVEHAIAVVPGCVPVHGAAMAWTPGLPIPGETTAFEAGAAGSGPFSFSWLFGDGKGGSGAPVYHAYTRPGLYTVQLVAANSCGQETITATLEVCQAVETASMEGPALLQVGEAALITATYGPSAATMPVTLTWSNGTSGPTTAYSWPGAGIYNVVVTATNACGLARGVRVVHVLQSVYLPLISRNWSSCFAGAWEAEDNDYPEQANGPLCREQEYQGYPDDQDDYFYIDGQPGTVTVQMWGYAPGVQGQLLLYDEQRNLVAWDNDPSDGWEVSCATGAQRYYIRVYTSGGYGFEEPYSVKVRFSW